VTFNMRPVPLGMKQAMAPLWNMDIPHKQKQHTQINNTLLITAVVTFQFIQFLHFLFYISVAGLFYRLYSEKMMQYINSLLLQE